ncbi:energy-coupling factor ABC transporter substrate-binding protein [Butyricicoccus sp.]|uniref:energy-coupling factor ABC transporter substrate-binding protein n=1 Tax=Butyricicoccus sp. TaxID=2049021 RepID=UPI00373607B5
MKQTIWKKNLVLLVLVAAIVVIPLVFIQGEYGGSDDQATDAIAEQNPDYEPWFSSLYEPPSGEIESLLFCLQAAAGAGVVGFVLGRLTAKKPRNDEESDDK